MHLTLRWIFLTYGASKMILVIYKSDVHPASHWQTGNVTAAAYRVYTGGLEA